ncbi:MAG: SDR family oxidoreductase [Pseudomonadota bacterium]
MNGLGNELRAALIAGCGDIGLRIARRLRAVGGEVTAILRNPQKRAALEALGAGVHMHDLDRPLHCGDWPWLFWLAPPPAAGTRDTRLRGWLEAQRGRIGRVVYVSTSGVYGDCGGRWIDEDEPLEPQTERALRRADAEAALLQWRERAGAQVVILRVPGIYGPGRLPVERLRRRLPVLRADDAPYSNRVHAEDLAAACVLGAQRGGDGRAYNIADGHPTTMTDYFRRCARVLGLDPPEEVDRQTAQRRFTPQMWSFMEESKRLKIDRARAELGYVPCYPDLDSGLAASL